MRHISKNLTVLVAIGSLALATAGVRTTSASAPDCEKVVVNWAYFQDGSVTSHGIRVICAGETITVPPGEGELKIHVDSV